MLSFPTLINIAIFYFKLKLKIATKSFRRKHQIWENTFLKIEYFYVIKLVSFYFFFFTENLQKEMIKNSNTSTVVS